VTPLRREVESVRGVGESAALERIAAVVASTARTRDLLAEYDRENRQRPTPQVETTRALDFGSDEPQPFWPSTWQEMIDAGLHPVTGEALG
jgi:hypothetical protein